MATGDDALAAGMQLVPGTRPANQLDTADNESRDYIANGHSFWRPTLPPLPVAKGGSGAADAATARTNLGITPANIKAPYDDSGSALRFYSPGFGRLGFSAPGISNGSELALAGGGGSYLPLSGGTLSGDLYIPGMSAVANSYVAMYRNGDGRLGISPSTLRVKRDVEVLDGHELAVIADAVLRLQLVTFYYTDELLEQGRPLRLATEPYVDDDDQWHDATYEPDPDWVRPDAQQEIGLIAEDLYEAGLEWLIFTDDDGRPLGIHFERLALALLPVIQDHEARLAKLEEAH